MVILGKGKSGAVRENPLRSLNWLLVLMIVVHDLDHVRQGRALDSELFGVGAVALVTAIVSLVLAARSHSFAPAAAIIVGFGNVVGVALVHVAPHWGPFSDPYASAHVDWFSWTVIFTMMLVGLMLGMTGVRALRNSPHPRRPAVSTGNCRRRLHGRLN